MKPREEFKGPVREQPHDIPLFEGQILAKVYFVFKYLSEHQDPLFLDSVFPQKLEKTGLEFARAQQSGHFFK